jgi:hypothetical protein
MQPRTARNIALEVRVGLSDKILAQGYVTLQDVEASMRIVRPKAQFTNADVALVAELCIEM